MSSINKPVRVFKHGPQEYSDPNPLFSPEEVRKHYSTNIDLDLAVVTGPEIEGQGAATRLVYSFTKPNPGTKG